MQAQPYDIPSGHIILVTGQPFFALNYIVPFICRAFDIGEESFNYQFENLWFDSAGNLTGSPRHGANALSLGYVMLCSLFINH